MGWTDDEQARWSDYARTRFRPAAREAPPGWLVEGERLGVVSAFNPGRQLGADENAARHRQLEVRVAALTPPRAVLELVGHSPEGDYEERCWAFECSEEEAVELGRVFEQDAVFVVSGGELFLLPSEPSPRRQGLAPWRERLAHDSG